MKRLSILAALLLTACDQPAADGYEFGQAEYRAESVTIRVVEHGRLLDLRATARAKGAEVVAGRELMAFAIITNGGKTCEVHMITPEVRWQPEWLGHEFAHCLYGRWH